jgi:hypothetical protein
MTLNRPKVFHHPRPAFRSFATDGNGQLIWQQEWQGYPKAIIPTGATQKRGQMTPLKALQTRAIVALFGRVSSPCLSSRSQQSRRGWFSPPIPAPRLFLFSRPQIMHMDDAMMKLWLVLRVLNEVTTSIGPLSPATRGATLFQNVRIFNGILIVNRVPLQM